jgi:hypothetical protein
MSRFAKVGLLFVLFVFVIIVIVGISRRCRVDRAGLQASVHRSCPAGHSIAMRRNELCREHSFNSSFGPIPISAVMVAVR